VSRTARAAEGVVFACIVPHGFEIVPEVARASGAGALDAFAPTRRAMEEIGRRIRRLAPETVVIATPHNLRLEGGFTAVVTSEFTGGTLARGEASVEASFPCDQTLAKDIVARASEARIPVVGANFGALSGPESRVAMDWGTLIPLYFIGRRTTDVPDGLRVRVGPWEGPPDAPPRPKVVIIGPSREVPWTDLVRLGAVVARAAQAAGRRTVFVASADHGHAHRADGPYGHDPASAAYDEAVCRMVRSGELERLLDLDPGFVEAAKPDSLWQMLILLGVLRERPMTGELLSYQAPTYFGMLCASYEP